MTLDPRSTDYITLELTPEQQRLVAQETGIRKRRIGANALGFLSMGLAADALRQGQALHLRCPIELQLTDDQKARLSSALGTTMSSIVFDADDLDPSFRESWPLDVESFVIGERFRVTANVPPGVRDDTEEPDDTEDTDGRMLIRLAYDGGREGAWGTGRHATSRLCVELLEKRVGKGTRVADVGAGSGILAIAAMRLGASSVVALETDTDAVASAKRNVDANHLVGSVEIRARPLDPHHDGPFELVVANLFPKVLLDLAAGLAAVTVSGGSLIFSGVVEPRFDDVVTTLTAVGFELEERCVLEGWTAAALRRRA